MLNDTLYTEIIAEKVSLSDTLKKGYIGIISNLVYHRYTRFFQEELRLSEQSPD